MTKLNEFKKYDFNITWKLIDIGFRGSDVFDHEIEVNDILNYAVQKIKNNDYNDLVCELVSTQLDNTDEIDRLLKILSFSEGSNENIEFRKWRVLCVAKILNKKYEDCVLGLVELGDLWAKFNYPKDSPHIIQGRNNNIRPEEYYTEDNYNKLLKRHQKWIDQEILFIHDYQTNHI